MEVDKKRVGQRIKAIRQAKGMTMEEFGSLFEATKGNVSLWEKGSSIPSNERLPLIAKIGDTTVKELLHGTPEQYISNVIHKSKTNRIIDTTVINAVISYYKDSGLNPYQDDGNINNLYNHLLNIFSEVDYEEIESDKFKNVEMYDLAVYLKRLKDGISEMIHFEELPEDERTASVLSSIDDISRLLIDLDDDFYKNEQRI